MGNAATYINNFNISDSLVLGAPIQIITEIN
jgi:hypothetical protein